MNFCGKCGNRFEAGNTFCTKCGAPVVERSREPATESPPVHVRSVGTAGGAGAIQLRLVTIRFHAPPQLQGCPGRQSTAGLPSSVVPFAWVIFSR